MGVEVDFDVQGALATPQASIPEVPLDFSDWEAACCFLGWPMQVTFAHAAG